MQPCVKTDNMGPRFRGDDEIRAGDDEIRAGDDEIRAGDDGAIVRL